MESWKRELRVWGAAVLTSIVLCLTVWVACAVTSPLWEYLYPERNPCVDGTHGHTVLTVEAPDGGIQYIYKPLTERHDAR